MIVVFDLDGTLIDASDRMYRLFQYLIPQSKLSKNDYWMLKRDKVNHRQIIEKRFSDISFAEFEENWMNLIEAEEYLEMDTIYNDTIETLEELSERGIDTLLLTARQSKTALISELERLGLLKFFGKVLVTEKKKEKGELLEEVFSSKLNIREKIIYISDMGRDVELGNRSGLVTIGITHGFMSRERLLEYRPHYLVDELYEIIEIVDCINRDSLDEK